MPLLRDVLNRLKWHPDERLEMQNVTITITDRLALGGLRSLSAESVREVHASYFLYEEDGELKHIPLHHVTLVRNDRTAAILWQKRMRRPR